MSIAEQGGKAVNTFVDSMKREPLSLALVVMNICLLVFFYVLLKAVTTQREREVGLLYQDHAQVRELLTKCIVPERRP